MNLRSVSTQTAVSTDTKVCRETETPLSGYWLTLARVGWFALAISTLGIFAASLPGYFVHLHSLCLAASPGNPSCYNGQLGPGSMHLLHRLGISIDSYAVFHLVLNIVLAFVWVAAGGLIFWQKSDNWMALLVAFLLIEGGAGSGGSVPALGQDHRVWLLPISCLNFLGSATLFLFLTLFPDGRFVPRWIRWLVAGEIVLVGFQYFFPTLLLSPTNWPPLLSTSVLLGMLGSMLIAQIYRYRRVSSRAQRQQTKWVVFACTIVIVGIIGEALVLNGLPHLSKVLAVPNALYPFVDESVWYVFPVFVPISFCIAILRYRLWDIDLIINRTLVYGVLTLSIVALYILVVVGLGALLQVRGNFGLSLLATGLIAVLFQPLRTWLQRAVNRLMYGDRDDPYRVISRLGQRLEATLAPEAVLPTIVETVAQALRLPYAGISLKQGEEFLTVASYGSARGDLVRLPLVSHTEAVGELVLAPRAPGENFTPGDRVLLSDLARQAGIAAHAVRLTEDLKQLTVDLQRSRERLVTTREEERRRLRRDLHDGLGPQLASLTLKLETARNRLAHDLLAQTLLSDLAQRTWATVTDIRRLVYALRPPALDELGLLSALRELTLQYGDQVSLHLDAPACLPELSAALEVAVYRIAQEALTNVVRHAAARHCDLRLALDESAGWLCLCIQDDGCGLPPSRGVGVGLLSMRERAEELGGTWTIEPLTRAGTCVLARLPYARTETPDALVVTPTVVPQEE
jgi:signal transduction histidine kinase